uniref:Uncharacterized protein n=1 Tax=Acrobeloides nanus TaxID=290746 RepID=A0A914CDE3_9BILA
MADDSILVQPSTSTANECMSEEKNLEIQAYDNSQCYCYLDDCNGILHGIPNSFDLGTIPVRLTCISVSTSYMAIGSSCGALFLFNRRLNKNVNPLRTSFKEVVTCIELFASKQDDFLALGHRSGTVILLCLPSRNPNGNRKIKQSIQEDGHKGQSIARMAWNENGTKLYTSDLNGLIMVTEVDFSAEVYNCLFVHNESRPIVQLISQNNFLAFCTTEKFFIFNSNDNHIIFETSNFSW